MKCLCWMILIACCFTGNFCSAQDAINSEIVFLLLNQKNSGIAPAEAKYRAEEWDKHILRGLTSFDPGNARTSASRHHNSQGADAIVRRYRSPIEMVTYQTEWYWILATSKESLAGVNPLKWAEGLLGEQGIRWLEEISVGRFRVQRCRVNKVGPTDYRQTPVLDRSIWSNTLRVLDDGDRIIVYVEKTYSNRPRIYSRDLNLHQEWFADIRDENDHLGRRVRARWWEFWKW